MKRGNHFFKSFAVFFTAVLLAAFPVTVRAEEVPSAENTDGGSISLNIVHYQAKSLTLSLDSSHLAFQDVTLNCTDAATGEPLCISLLAAPGTSDYTLYDLDTPAEELSGTLNISMITEPGYELNLDEAVFRIGGQTYSSGSTAVLHTPSSSVNSSVTCSEMALPEIPAVPETPKDQETPETPAESEIPAQPETPSVSETTAKPETPAAHEASAVHTEPESYTSVNSAAQTASQTAPEVLSTVPVSAEQSAPAPQQTAETGSHAEASVSSAKETETILETAEQTPEKNTSVSSPEAAETSEVHVSDLTERLNLVLAVLVLIVLILLLAKLLLTLKREKKHNRYRRYRFR